MLPLACVPARGQEVAAAAPTAAPRCAEVEVRLNGPGFHSSWFEATWALHPGALHRVPCRHDDGSVRAPGALRTQPRPSTPAAAELFPAAVPRR